jgi:hypothetical protein
VNTSLPFGNMSQPFIETRSLSRFWKLTVVFLVSCGCEINGLIIDRVNISNGYAKHISMRDGTIKCTFCYANKIDCYSLTGQHIWTFKDENVLLDPKGIALDKNKNVYVAGPFEILTRSMIRPLGSKFTMWFVENIGIASMVRQLLVKSVP